MGHKSGTTPENNKNLLTSKKCAFTLAEVFSNHFAGQRKAAFTLAEVLITLGIIGIVAAMTLPTIIQNKQNRELKAALLKNYQALQNALQKAAWDEGENISVYSTGVNRDYTGSLKKVLMKQLKTAKDCGNEGCAKKYDSNNTYLHYTTFTGKSEAGILNLIDDGQFMLSDGSMYYLEAPSNAARFYISIDVNGINKKPNRLGHDLFTFQIMDNGKLLPMGADGTYYNNKDTFCSKNSTNWLNGIACAYSALTDRNYWKNLPK